KDFKYPQLIHELEERFFRAPFTIVVCGAVRGEAILKQTRRLVAGAKDYVWGKVAFEKPRRRMKSTLPRLGRPYFGKTVTLHHPGANQIQVAFAYPGVSLNDENEI